MAYGTKLARFATIEDAERYAFKQAQLSMWAKPNGAPTGFLYRVEAVSYSVCVDPDREEYSSTSPALEVNAYSVRNWTAHGATLDIYSGARPKWVDLRPGAKQWASRTAREAVQQFLNRRNRQIWILDRQRQRAKFEAGLAVSALLGPSPEPLI